MGLGRFELPTSPLSGVRSNQLSYRPIHIRDLQKARPPHCLWLESPGFVFNSDHRIQITEFRSLVQIHPGPTWTLPALPGCASLAITRKVSRTKLNMQSGYAAHDHRKERPRSREGLIQTPRNRSQERDFRGTWQHPIRALLDPGKLLWANCLNQARSAIADAHECHDVLS